MSEIRTIQLNVLRGTLAECRKCNGVLRSNHHRTVFGKGSYDAKIVFLGDFPDAEETKSGLSLVGNSGRMIRDIIKEMGWEKDVFVTSLMKCSVASSDSSMSKEISNCDDYLQQQLKLIVPKYMVCLGNMAAYHILKPKVDFHKFEVGEHRRKMYRYGNIKVACTWHPRNMGYVPTKEAILGDLKFFKNIVMNSDEETL